MHDDEDFDRAMQQIEEEMSKVKQGAMCPNCGEISEVRPISNAWPNVVTLLILLAFISVNAWLVVGLFK